MEDIVDIGVGALSIDNIADLKKCTETVGDRIKITEM